MKVKAALLQAYIDKQSLTIADFARETEMSIADIERLLGGEAVDKPTARKFIYFFGAVEAQIFIDWAAMGITNPLASETVND